MLCDLWWSENGKANARLTAALWNWGLTNSLRRIGASGHR